MIVWLIIFVSGYFILYWYFRFKHILPLQKKIYEYERFYPSFEDFAQSLFSVIVSFNKEDYLNLINILLVKLNSLISDATFYVIEGSQKSIEVVSILNEREQKADLSKIKNLVFSIKDDLSFIERTDIFEGEKTFFAVLSIKTSFKNIYIVALIDEEDKDIILRFFKFLGLFLKTFFSYYEEIMQKNLEIKKLKTEIDNVVKELENHQTRLIKKHREAKLIYEGISSFNHDLTNPVSNFIELIYRTILPSFVVFYRYNESSNKLNLISKKPNDINIPSEIPIDNSESLIIKSFVTNNPLYITNEAIKDFNSYISSDIKTFVIFPVSALNSKYGVLVVGSYAKKAYSQEDIRLLEIVVKEMSLFLNLSDLYSQVSHYAIKMENLNKIKDDFISSVNHEIKTPLTTIKGFLSVLLSGEAGSLNDQQTNFLMIIDQAATRLMNIITNLLDISRIHSKVEFNMESLDIVKLVDETLASLRMKAHIKNINIVFEPELKPAFVLADKHWIREVISNIVDNAIKYSFNGGVVNIGVYDKGDFVFVSVKDEGCGIDEEDKRFIFEKFFRGKNVVFNTEGSGLGLAVAKAIIEKHGGRIWFESEKGKGSKFYFALKKAQL